MAVSEFTLDGALYVTFNEQQEMVRVSDKLYRATLSYATSEPVAVETVFIRKGRLSIFDRVVTRKVVRRSKLFDRVGSLAKEQRRAKA